jgi:nucleoid-associated protein
LTKFVGSGGGLTLSFEQKLLNSRVFYDPQTDTLTIRGPAQPQGSAAAPVVM